MLESMEHTYLDEDEACEQHDRFISAGATVTLLDFDPERDLYYFRTEEDWDQLPSGLARR